MKLAIAWIKAHARQLATFALWLAVMVVAHRWPAHTADVEFVVSAVALAVGIQLPPFKFSAEALTKIVAGALVIGALVLAPLALLKCDAPAGTWKATDTAAAGLAVDFSQCVENDFFSLATSGALSKDAALASAEKCGIANVKDGLVLLVAAFNDVKNYLLAKYSSHDAAVVVEDAGAVQ